MTDLRGSLPSLLNNDWAELLAAEFKKPYWAELAAFLSQEDTRGSGFLPAKDNIFRALELTAFDEVKVVIIGQDPYHGADQAIGLAFAVAERSPLPPSLKNILKEVATDFPQARCLGGSLLHWPKQGVLLINTVLTVAPGIAGSHRGVGWELFTDQVVGLIGQRKSAVVFMLWGADAKRKAKNINRDKHCVLEAPHPSPLSAYRGFFGCGHFRLANEYFSRHGHASIDW